MIRDSLTCSCDYGLPASEELPEKNGWICTTSFSESPPGNTQEQNGWKWELPVAKMIYQYSEIR